VQHSEKITLMEKHLSGLGVGQWTYSPPAYRLLWAAGIKATPPLFASFASIAIGQGVYFGVFWGLFMWIFMWSKQSPPMPLSVAFITSVFAGVMFGLIMAVIYRRKAAKLGLPSWAAYTGKAEV
jgi:hypothetical protein